MPERASSLILIPGTLLKRRLLAVVLLVEEVFDDVGDAAYTYSPSTYWASLKKVVRFSRRV